MGLTPRSTVLRMGRPHATVHRANELRAVHVRGLQNIDVQFFVPTFKRTPMRSPLLSFLSTVTRRPFVRHINQEISLGKKIKSSRHDLDIDI